MTHPPLILAVPLLLAAGMARADMLIDNIGEPIRNPAVVSSTFWSAQSFITSGAGPVELQSIELRLGMRIGDPGVLAELRADTPTGPGALIANLGLTALDTGPTRPTALGVPPGLVLAPATTYWLVLGATGSGSVDWSYAAGNAASGSGSFGFYAFSTTQGADWTGLGMEDPYMARIQVSAVPEPSGALLAVLGIAVMGLLGRQRARREGEGL